MNESNNIYPEYISQLSKLTGMEQMDLYLMDLNARSEFLDLLELAKGQEVRRTSDITSRAANYAKNAVIRALQNERCANPIVGGIEYGKIGN